MNLYEHHHDKSSEDPTRIHPEATQQHHEHGPIVDHVHAVDIHGKVSTNKKQARGKVAKVGDAFYLDEPERMTFNDRRMQRMEQSE